MVKTPIKAIAVFQGKIKGHVDFVENLEKNTVLVNVHLSGLKKSQHGFHVHETGDLTNQCESLCAHFNPYGKKHGGRDSKERHVGDLGNLDADEKGEVVCSFEDHMIKLRGSKCNIIGRGLIVHADADDCGKGDNAASIVNGNAGKRIACAIIGIA